MLLPVEEEQAAGISRRGASALPISDFWRVGGRTIAIPSIGNRGRFGLSQRRALILVLVLSFALCAGIWVTVALLSVAGGDDLG